jgi:hypothetical protein
MMTQSLLRFIQSVHQDAINHERQAMTQQLGLPLAQVVYKVVVRRFANSLERFAIACTGAVARVVYSRTFPSLTKPQTGRLNKSPHTVHAIANRHNNRYFSGSPCKLKAAQKNGALESARSHISTCARRNAAPTGSFCSSKFR